LAHLTARKLALFDSMRKCPEEAVMKNGKLVYFRAKTWMYELSPFEETLFLDADMLWFSARSVNQLIATLGDVEWTIQNRGYIDLSQQGNESEKYFWGDIKDVRKCFPQGRLYSLHSELVWFKRSDATKAYFDLVRQVYDHPPVKAFEFAGDIADELAFALACMRLDRYPHRTPFSPVYWYKMDSRQGTEITRLKEKFYAYSVGGCDVSALEMKKYNFLARGYASRMGVQYPFRLQPKRKFLPERHSI
jgi:hypothetical protein